MPGAPLLRQPDHPPIKLRSPADLIAVTPYLLGFHPDRSVVLLGFHSGLGVFAARSDLPGPQTPPAVTMASDLASLAARQGVTEVALLGYGPANQVDPLLMPVRAAAADNRLDLMDVIRIDGGRWWSYLCEHLECCPPEGTAIDLTTTEVSARCTFAGLTALPDRDEVARKVAALEGPARVAMGEATERASGRLAQWLSELPEPQWASRLLTEGRSRVTAAITRYGEGGALDDDELAWLSLLLTAIPVRDAAWEAITADEPDLRLWSDATRRVEPTLVPAPASLLAFTAWRRGDGTLAQLALDRALQADPSYSMARLLADGLRQGLPPSTLDGWGTPEWAERLAALRPARSGRHRPRRARSKRSRRG